MTQVEIPSGRVFADRRPAPPRPLPAPPFVPPRFVAAAYRRAFLEALRRSQFGVAGALVNTRHGCPGYFRFIRGDGAPEHQTVIPLRFEHGHCTFALNPHLLDGDRLDFVSYRITRVLMLFAGLQDAPDGTVALNIDDYGLMPGLAFSDGRPDRWLIPDPVYLMENGYRHTAEHYRRYDIPWAERAKVAFWRGATTGGEIDYDRWETLDRIRLCMIAASHPDKFDAGIVGVVQLNEADTAAVNASGLVRDFVPETNFIAYRYQIDIDGNTNSWPGLFQKLLTGSPVLKVASRYGYRQWYYDRLTPWENFVPVAADMSDLVEKVDWLRTHDDEAQRIGAAGRSLALSMTVPAELERARSTVRAALAASTAP